MKKGLIVVGAILIAITPFIVLAATVYTLMLPNIYQSSARVSVTIDTPEFNPFEEPGAELAYNPYFLKTQLELLTSKPILYEVIKRQNLQEEWSRDSEKLSREVTFRILRNSVQVFHQRETSVIAISVKRDTPDEAADIANEIAEVYRDSRMDLALKNGRGALEKIQTAIKEQARRVEAAERNVNELRMELGAAAMPKNQSPEIVIIKLQQLEKDRVRYQSEMLEKEQLIKVMDEYKEEGVIEQASRITFDEGTTKLVGQILDVEAKLIIAEAEPEENVAELKRYRAQRDALVAVLAQRIQANRNGLETEYLIASQTYENLNKSIEEIHKSGTGKLGLKPQPLRRAESELESEQFIYDQLKVKHRQEVIALEVPRIPVEIIDVAEANRRPVSPNLFLNIIVSIVIAGSVGLVGAIFLTFGLRKNRV